MMTAIQVRAKRAEHDGRAWHTVELVPANSESRATWSTELAAALSRVRLRFPTTHYEHRTRTQNPDDHHHIPAETVRLGQVLDLVTQLGPIRTTWDTELSGWQLLTDSDAMRRRAGQARLYLVRGSLRTPNPAAIGEHAADTYEQWHERAARFVGEIDELPDLIGVYIGRALRLGYRSDKWGREGEHNDYDHDFSERGHTPPEAWADSAELAQARAIVIVGGDMRVTPEGID